MNYDDWFKLYREEEDYEYYLFVDNELRRLKKRAERRGE